MKFALFIILLVGFFCVAQARNNFLDDLFLSSVTLSNDVDMAITCNATDSCAGKGDTCNGVYGSGNCVQDGASAANGTCCAAGLYCVNSTCITDTVGDACKSNSDCYTASPTPLQCIAGTCTYVYGIGDSCSNNTDCQTGNCTNSVCQGGMYGQACAGNTCNFGLYCYLNITDGDLFCQNTTAEGGNCTSSAQCAAGTTCFSSSRTNGTLSQPMCQTIGTQSEGNPCMDNSACDSGTVCYMGNCTTVGTSMTSCTNSTSCGTGAFCICSYVTGDLYCAGTLYNNPCTDEQLSLQSCLASSSCSEATDAPNSCSYANCLSQYKKSISCGCSFASSVSGGCSYNQYCGGFPVWAIIVIIVVAIVLVLAIVLLVFFMMRRRRQYDSI